MTYGIELTDVADMEAMEIFLWILGRSPTNAGKWQAGLDKSLDSLREFPHRCPLAPEHELFSDEVRQHLYGNYRVLFTLVDTNNDGVEDTVRVLHIRHGAMDYLGGQGS